MTVLQTVSYIDKFDVFASPSVYHPKRTLTHWGEITRNSGMRKPIAREWTDPRTGKVFLRVRTTDANGKVIARMFSEPNAANEYIKTLVKERGRHGRAAAVNSDEIDALRVWREFVSKENTEGRDVPALRDVLKTAIERLRDGATSPALDSLWKLFMDAREREAVSTRHLAALKNRLKRFVSYFDKDEPAGSVTTEQVERAMGSMRAGGLSPQTVKGVRTAAHGLFQWGLDRNLVSANPITRAKAPKVTQGEVGVITASQLKGLLRTALSIQPCAVPALAVWAFCGVRRAELTRLRFEDLDIKRKELRISAKAAKTGVARFVPLPDALLAWLDASKSGGVAPLGKLIAGDSEEKSEGQLNRWLREIRPEAGLLEWPNNALRHSFASYATAMHDDFSKVAAWLGHARDPRLLVAKYRHAVAKDAGEAWFDVLPDAQPKVTKATTKKPRAKKPA